MLRIIHTGRAYEVLDLLPTTYCFPDNRKLLELRSKYATLRTRYLQQGAELEKVCREVALKALLFDLRATELERKLKATKLELKLCQKSTLNT